MSKNENDIKKVHLLKSIGLIVIGVIIFLPFLINTLNSINDGEVEWKTAFSRELLFPIAFLLIVIIIGVLLIINAKVIKKKAIKNDDK